MYLPAKHTDSVLLQNVANGDEQAFRQLFEQYADGVYGVAFAYVKSPELAEELVQDIFLKIWLKKEKLPEITGFTDYLFIVARNHILNMLRKKIPQKDFKEHLTAYFADAVITPEQQLLLKESSQLIRSAIGQLPPQQQAVYRLSRQGGLSLEEIAGELQLSRNTVRNHLSRALQHLRHYLAEHAGERKIMLLLPGIINFFLK
jgi:RNA polymerase sigma-70 factor (ECF subfamily)